MSKDREIVGVVPAAGLGSRLGRIAGSKEMFPVGWQASGPGAPPRPKPVCLHLLEAMRASGIRRVFMVIRRGKWDIPEYLGDGSELGMDLGYLLMERPWGAPYTVDQAFPFVADSIVALGFPDIIFEPPDAHARLARRLAESGADVVLGLFPAAEPSTCDMVTLGEGSEVARIDIKPARTDATRTWGIAVWSPDFTRFLHEHLARTEAPGQGGREAYVGEVVQAAIGAGLRVDSVEVSDRPYLDVGIPDNLVRAIRRYSAGP